MPNAQLIDIQRVTGRKDYALNTPITQIGRVKGKESPDVDHIVIEESRVSRHHAVIEYKNHGFWVMDQGSGNGTFLNGERLTEERHLKHNDILSFDKFEFMYFEPDMEQSDATVVQGAAPADRISRPFDEDETALQGPEEVETPPPPPPQVPDTHTADLVEDIESWDFGDTEEGDEEESQAHTIVPESLNDEEVEIEEDTGEKLPPETAAEEPAKIEESAQKEVLIEKKDGTFQPAKTMTPKEFERLFSEIDKDKK
ncbi:MAG: FHA domain-containing protein [Gammaproteobacteria bacterium]|nr:MAG: FHA domain-containing protein [Gammaproteobacteria bacterium]